MIYDIYELYDYENALPNDNHRLDCFLYLATYSFLKNTTSKTIIEKMLKTFDINVQPNRNYIISNKLNISDILIKGYLIEKDLTVLYVMGHRSKLYNC